MLTETLAELRRRCVGMTAEAALEKDPSPGGGGVFGTGWPEADRALGEGLPWGLHEWFGVGEARAARNEPHGRDSWAAPLGIAVHLAWQAVEHGARPRCTTWIGGACHPFPQALIRCGDGRLLESSLFIFCHKPADRLWAVDLCLRSPVVGMAIGDGRCFDMAATRRIQLLARERRKWALLVRPPWERKQLSAAGTRWEVRNCCGGSHWQATATLRDGRCLPVPPIFREEVSNPRWSVVLLRCKGVQPACVPQEWTLEWDRADGRVRLSAPLADHAGEAEAAAEGDRRAWERTA